MSHIDSGVVPRYEIYRPAVDYGYYANGLFIPEERGLFADIRVPVFFRGTLMQEFAKVTNAARLDASLDQLSEELSHPLKFYADAIEVVAHAEGENLIKAFADDSTVNRFKRQSDVCKEIVGKKGHIVHSVALGKTADERLAEVVANKLRSTYTGNRPAALLHFAGAVRA